MAAPVTPAFQALLDRQICLPEPTIAAYEQAYLHLKWSAENYPEDLIHKIGELKFSNDQVRIWDVLWKGPAEYRFPGDVLGLLMRLKPYPVVNRRPGPVLKVDAALCRQGTFMQHPGCPKSFNVDITDDIKIFEKHTDWYEVLGFDEDPSPPFAKMLDQIHLESSKNPGTKGHFASPFKHHKFPITRVAALWNQYRDPLACEILQDWGYILRSVDQKQTPPNSQTYLRAVMEFLTRRFGYDRIVV
jgi:hypothetical protein